MSILWAQRWAEKQTRCPALELFLPSTVPSRAGTTNLQVEDSGDRDGEKVTSALQPGHSLQIAAEEGGWCWGEHVLPSPGDAGPLRPPRPRVPLPSWLSPALPVVLAVGLHANQHPQTISPARLPLPLLLPAHWDRGEGENRPGPPRGAVGVPKGSPMCSVAVKA